MPYLVLSLKDKNHKDINMKYEKQTTQYFLKLLAMTFVVFSLFFVLVLTSKANAQQSNSYASCESPNEIILQRKACDKRFNDCLPLPKFNHNHFKLKCIEEDYEDKSKPIYAKNCPEGGISHTETICEAPEFLAENQGENCYDVEVMCQPESYMIGTRMVLVEDVELVQAQREIQERKDQIARNRAKGEQVINHVLFLNDERQASDIEKIQFLSTPEVQQAKQLLSIGRLKMAKHVIQITQVDGVLITQQLKDDILTYLESKTDGNRP